MGKLKTPWTSKMRTIKSKAFERAGEIGRWTTGEQAATTAREKESNTGTLWSILGTGACLLTGLGPACIPIGTAIGKVAKGYSGGSLSAVEDTKMDTSDVGRWYGTEDKAALEQTNRMLEKYDKGEFWNSVKDFGMSLLSAYRMGGGISPTEGFTPGDFSMTKWGGEAAGQTTGEAIGSLFGAEPAVGESFVQPSFGEGPGPSFGEGPGMGVSAPDIVGGDLGPAPPAYSLGPTSYGPGVGESAAEGLFMEEIDTDAMLNDIMDRINLEDRKQEFIGPYYGEEFWQNLGDLGPYYQN